MLIFQDSKTLIPYPQALSQMASWTADSGDSLKNYVWFLEHPPLYTAGSMANPKDCLQSSLPVYQTGRGGQYTYHGPGQRVVYLILNLKNYQCDIKWYVHQLEGVLIQTLASLGVRGERRTGRIGVWVITEKSEKKIAAIGVRVSKWITSHGFSLNVNPNMSYYQGIIPCGLNDYGVTSLHELDVMASMDEVDALLKKNIQAVFKKSIFD